MVESPSWSGCWLLGGGSRRSRRRPHRSPGTAPAALRGRRSCRPTIRGSWSVRSRPRTSALLNKYNIVDRHLLIVTREYEEQESALTAEDLAAARICLGAIDGLAFYNSAAAAGASQSHKHLQLVPFPLGPNGERFPLDRALASALGAGYDAARELGYRHRIANLGSSSDLAVYRDLVASCGLDLDGGAGHRPAPYNLLMTRHWMLVVPRSSGATGPIEVNALGFAGALAVRGEEDLSLVREVGPLEILCRVGLRAPSSAPPAH